MTHDTEFINPRDFIKSNPDLAVSKVMKAGVELWYKIEDPVGERDIHIQATSSGEEIGNANFSEDVYNTDIQNIFVEPAFRRRGVGKAMCVLAEKILRKPLRNIFDARETSKEFKTFWDHLVPQLNNQFD